RTGDPLFLVVPRECIVRGFGENAKSIGTRSTGLVLNNVPWFVSTLQEYGDPQPDPQLTVSLASKTALKPGNEASVVVRITNKGSTPITDLRASFHSRVDFRTSGTEAPNAVASGETVELTYKLAAPSLVNTQCLCNRVAYAHWSAIYRRDQAVHLGHAPLTISLED